MTAPLALVLASLLQTAQPAPAPGAGTAVDLREVAKQLVATREALRSIPQNQAQWPSLKVNDTVVSPDDVRRTALYFTGEQAVATIRLNVAIEQELQRMKTVARNAAKAKKLSDADAEKAATEAVSAFIVSDEEFKKKKDEFRQKLEELRPEISWDQFLSSRQMTESSFDWDYRTQMLFDAIFLPQDTTKWPELTLDACTVLVPPNASPKERADQIDKVKQAFLSPAGKNPGNVFVILMIKREILKKLTQSAPLLDAMDGIPPGVGIVCGDHAFSLPDLGSKGVGLGSFLDSLHGMELAAVSEAVRQAIVEKEEADWEAAKKVTPGAKRPVYWLKEGSPEFKDAFAAEALKYPTPPFDHAGIVRFRRFPTMQVYRMYFRLLESYRRATAKERTDEALAKYVDDSKLFWSSGAVDAEVIWYSYMADLTKLTEQEGFEGARERAERGLADIRHGAELASAARKASKEKGTPDNEAEKAAIEAARGFTFRDVLERDSDYKDPKPATEQQGFTPEPMNRGRFGPQQRNPLTEKLHESELAALLQGYAVGEELFYRVPVGEVIGPVRGPKGYYIARVVSRNPGVQSIDLKDPKKRELALDDWVNHAFQEFAAQAVAKAKISVGRS